MVGYHTPTAGERQCICTGRELRAVRLVAPAWPVQWACDMWISRGEREDIKEIF